MGATLGRWRRRLFLLACGSYWTVLVLVLFGPPTIAAWRVSRPDGGHGVINASLSGATLSIAMSSSHTAPWSASIGLWTIAFWLVGPPLVLWLALRGIQQRDPVAPLRTTHR
jgi:hypothetical protein